MASQLTYNSDSDCENEFESVSGDPNGIFGIILQPNVLISDSADAIENGFKKVFDNEFARVICWAHVYRAYAKKLSSISDKNLENEINEDIYKLQLCNTTTIFQRASQLWIEKWTKSKNQKVIDFVTYFTTNWFTINSGWYEGIAPGHPSTNNATESSNKLLKDEFTMRCRLPLGEFMNCMQKNLQIWSCDRDPDSVNYMLKKFNQLCPLHLPLQTSAYQWVHSKPHILIGDQDGSMTTYYFAAKDCRKVTLTRVKPLSAQGRHTKWKTFDDFLFSEFTVWKLIFIADDWQKSYCSCPSFQKDYICKHMLGVAAMQKKWHFLPAAKNIPLGQKRKRGRPKRATKALLK